MKFKKNESLKSENQCGDLANVGVGDPIGQSQDALHSDAEEDPRKNGYHYLVAAFFLVAQMAGAGFLALPKAIAEAGWCGIFLLVFFCFCAGHVASKLGTCWVILEERWEKYRQPARQPYMDIAEMSLGKHGRRLALFSVLVTQIGSTIVYIILMAEMMASLVPAVSQCEWTLIFAALLLPFVWLDSPKDFWQASVLAVVATVVAIVVIVVKLLIDREIFLEMNPTYPNPTLTTFSLALGTILFAYSGAPCFPTVQNDMKCRADFWKGAIIAFITILTLYLPVAIVAYVLLGESVQSNVLLSVGPSVVVTIAIAMQIINLFGTYVIAISPAVLSLEDIFGIPRKFGWQRVTMRSLLMVIELIVAFAIPDFGLIMNLIGGSTMSILAFILPSLMYIKLVDDKSDKRWPDRSMLLMERIFLWFVIIIGLVGGISATVTAVMALVQPSSFKKSCFVNFLGVET